MLVMHKPRLRAGSHDCSLHMHKVALLEESNPFILMTTHDGGVVKPAAQECILPIDFVKRWSSAE